MTLTNDDPKVPIKYQGQSRLKRLHLNDSYIDTRVLHNILSIPRALSELTIFYCIPNRMKQTPPPAAGQ